MIAPAGGDLDLRCWSCRTTTTTPAAPAAASPRVEDAGLTREADMEAIEFEFGSVQDLIDEGGVQFIFSSVVDFVHLGPVVVTPGVVTALGLHGQGFKPVASVLTPWLLRHAQGDFGKFGHVRTIEVTDDQLRRGCFATDDAGTLSAIAHRDGAYTTVHSSYADVPGIEEVWVMTDRRGRPQTTVLLPDEY